MIAAAPPPPHVAAPFRAVDPAHTLVIETSRGRVFVELRPDLAPKSVERVEVLARRGTYDGLLVHRVLAGRFVQTGNPNNRDGGGTELPDLPLEVYRPLDPARVVVASRAVDGWSGYLGAQPVASWQPRPDGRLQAWGVYCEGVMGMGRQHAPDTGNSEIFITFRPERGFDHDYAVVGRVVAGLGELRSVAVGEPPAKPDRMMRVRVLADIPAAERPVVEVEDTASPGFATRIGAVRRARGADFSVCDVPLAGRVR